jgi:hypothetical protein
VAAINDCTFAVQLHVKADYNVNAKKIKDFVIRMENYLPEFINRS